MKLQAVLHVSVNIVKRAWELCLLSSLNYGGATTTRLEIYRYGILYRMAPWTGKGNRQLASLTPVVFGKLCATLGLSSILKTAKL